MANLVRRLMMLGGLFVSNAAWADCSVSADAGAMVRPLSLTAPADADLVVSMSMVPKLMHLDYKAAAQRPKCDLGPLAAANDTYELRGDDESGRSRKALPVRKGGPIAMVVPIFDMLKAIQGAQAGRKAATEGYLLAVVTTSDLTGWRFYTAMPDVATLKRDMAQALAGEGKPIFKNSADGKTAMFLSRR